MDKYLKPPFAKPPFIDFFMEFGGLFCNNKFLYFRPPLAAPATDSHATHESLRANHPSKSGIIGPASPLQKHVGGDFCCVKLRGFLEINLPGCFWAPFSPKR